MEEEESALKASELLTQLSELVARHGDLEILYECDNVPMALASVGVFDDRDESLPPVFIIYPPSDEDGWAVYPRPQEEGDGSSRSKGNE